MPSFKSVSSVLTAIAAVAAPLPALAQSSDAPPAPAISADLVARLCPAMGLTGLKLGAPRSAQPPELLRSLRRLPAQLAPFTEAELEVTTWSGRVAGVTYRAASPDGEINSALLESFDSIMLADGWELSVTDETVSPMSILGGRALERTVEGPEGKRQLLLEFDASGALALRCADRALLAQAKRELDGTLDQGSPRPQRPSYDSALKLPEPAACDSPALQRLAASRENMDEYAPEMVTFAAAAMRDSDQAQWGKRLNTWLEWRLLGSGKITDDKLTALREKYARSGAEDEMRMTMELLGIMGEVAEAREHGDQRGSCLALRKMMVFESAKNKAEADFWQRVNTALEAEAKRLGVVLD